MAKPLPKVVRKPDRFLDVGAYRLSFSGIRSIDFGESTWEGWYPLDGRTIALVSAGTRHVDIGQHRYVGGAQTWIADLAAGTRELLARDQALISIDPSGTRLLMFALEANKPVWSVTDRVGRVLSSIPGPYSLTFLNDDSVIVVDTGRIGIWAIAAGSVSWSDLPARFDDVRVAVVGRNVVTTGSGVAALIDPITGNEIGETWPAGPAGGVAASPDGLRFAVAVGSADEPRGRVEIRNAETGALLAADPGRAFTTIEGIVWPTDNLIIVMRAATGSGVEPIPEIHTLDDFDSTVVETDRLVPEQLAIADHDGVVLAWGLPRLAVLLTAAESAR